MASRSYGQFCAVATAMDVVGDRWALLVVRQLLAGPQRYSDLQAGLPGISTDVLAARLRDLDEAGIVVRRRLPAPAASTVYELTDDGRALEPVVSALARWGLRRLPDTVEGAFRPEWLLTALRAVFRPDAADGRSGVVAFTVDGVTARVRIDGDGVVDLGDAAGPSDLAVTADPAALVAAISDPERRAQAMADGRLRVEGDPAVAALVRDTLALVAGA